MRVSPICVWQNSMNLRSGIQRKENFSPASTTASLAPVKSVSFKNGGVGATIGTVLGVGLGALITAGTGGLALPLILGVCGCAGGAIAGSEDVSESYPGEHDGYDDNGFSHYD